MFEFNPDKVRDNARNATTEDLLSRVTAYRNGMQPEAIEIIEEELRNRGIGAMEIHAHRNKVERDLLFDTDGLPVGLQIAGKPFDETTVCQVAHAYEQATPWHEKHPNL